MSDTKEKKNSGKKLFATDFDWTLNLYPDGVSKECHEMIAKFRKEGNYFGIITGRTYSNSADIMEKMLAECDFFMCMTGAFAIDPQNNVLFEYRGDGSIIPGMIKLLYSLKGRYLFYTEGRETIEIDVCEPLEDDSPAMLETYRHPYFNQINTAYETREDLERALAVMNERYGDKINPQLNGLCVDIPPAGVSKGTAVLRMAEYFGVDRDGIFCAGDNDNDVSMLEMHHGYTLPHGSDRAKAAAEKIFGNVAEMLDDVMKR